MTKALTLLLSLPLVACVVGDGTTPQGGDDQGSGTGSGSGNGSGSGSGDNSGHITMDTTWTGATPIAVSTTIDPGVTVTAMAGATISIAAGASLTVGGTLDIVGTSGSIVTIMPDGGAASFEGISVPMGGTITADYLTLTGAELTTSGTATVSISNSQLSHSPGDLLVMNGGNLTVINSSVGLALGQTGDTTHCDQHFGGTGNVISVTHSNISTSSYGVMFYSGTSAVFTYNNWFSNSVTDVDSQPGVSGDFSYGYFQRGAPTGVAGATITAGNLSATMLPACDGTNGTTCAGPLP